MVDFDKLKNRAKDIVEQRGGTDSLKQDARELKDIAKGEGTAQDKLRQAAEAIRTPGAGPQSSGSGGPETGGEPVRPSDDSPPQR